MNHNEIKAAILGAVLYQKILSDGEAAGENCYRNFNFDVDDRALSTMLRVCNSADLSRVQIRCALPTV